MISSKDTFNIKGLDGLRFIGTVIVILFHIEKRKVSLGIPSIAKYYVKSGLGQCAMTSFFVLSGFLIIYILLKEKNDYGFIDTSRFYKRRMARIWPLYYIIILLVILFFDSRNFVSLTMPLMYAGEYYKLLAIYFLHLPNFSVFFTVSILPLSHLWSLGVEEQFYLFCPWIVKKTKRVLNILIFIVVIKMMLKISVAGAYRLLNCSNETTLFLKHLEHFLFIFRVEAFAIGGISAYLLIEKKDQFLNFIYQSNIQFLNLIILILTIPLGYYSESMHLLFSINFGIMILNMAGNSKPVFMLNNKYTNYIGKISYGIYMYQMPIIIMISSLFAPYYSANHSVLWNVLYLITCVFLTFIVSVISYELIERKILDYFRKN
jgi:peptidoglycan/LPS O-acetylase OafA/YrhL